MKRLAVFASGRGTNFRAIVDHTTMDILRGVEVRLLVTNIPGTAAAHFANERSIPVSLIEGVYGRKFANRQDLEKARNEFDETALKILTQNRIDLVALAGFMQVLGPRIVNAYRFRIMNIHPAKDLSRFGGRGMFGERVHTAVLRAGERESGCTIHYVDDRVDGGPIIIQSTVPIAADDTPDTLAHRILIHEHRTYSKAIQLHVDGRIKLEGQKVSVDWSGNWEERWNQRQETFIRQQTIQTEDQGALLQPIL
jgi:formyltetrahydrofolate-dependent phosphoribosylglycinamide formyltransferase